MPLTLEPGRHVQGEQVGLRDRSAPDAGSDPAVQLLSLLLRQRAVAGIRVQHPDVLVSRVRRVPEVAADGSGAEHAARIDLRVEVGNLLGPWRRAVVGAREDGVVVRLHLDPELVATRWKDVLGVDDSEGATFA